MVRFALLVALLTGGWAAITALADAPAPAPAAEKLDPAGVDFFEKKVRPVFVSYCYECHSAKADKLKGGLRLDSKVGLMHGGDSGPAIVPGKPNESRLIKAIRLSEPDLKMPPKRPLPPEIVADLEKWVAM